MSRVLPILFNTEMVRAILDGRKTVTRRICKDGDAYSVPDMEFYDAARRTYGVHSYSDLEHKYTNKLSIVERPCPICPGDTLYVRETWRVGAWDIRRQMIAFDYKDGTCGGLTHIQDRIMFERLVNQSREDAREAGCEYNGRDFVWDKGRGPCRLRPSIHMPKEAARIWLKVTDVRVERLQEIGAQDAWKEGARCTCMHPVPDCAGNRAEFINIWNSTIKKSYLATYGWDANPWVWVIEFERCGKQEE